jgi:GMP synthase-like glutamine amidotransferase
MSRTSRKNRKKKKKASRRLKNYRHGKNETNTDNKEKKVNMSPMVQTRPHKTHKVSAVVTAPSFFMAETNIDVSRMFSLFYGMTRIHKQEDADFVVFPGGIDIDPSLYGERDHPQVTMTSPSRDTSELQVLKHMLPGQKAIGICRGAQLLNVAFGGTLIQHINHHARVRHWVKDLITDESFLINSRHHQAMIPTRAGEVWTMAGTSTVAETFDTRLLTGNCANTLTDVEAVSYKRTSTRPDSLLFQAHPEDDIATRAYFTKLLIRKGFIKHAPTSS